MSNTDGDRIASRTSPAVVALAWLVVGAPLFWGVYETLKKAVLLLR